MKKQFFNTLTIICAVIILISVPCLNGLARDFVSGEDISPALRAQNSYARRAGDIDVLVGKDYIEVISSCIRNAGESVYVKMYLFTEPDLARELIDAYKRGLQVTVTLDRLSENDRKNKAVYKLLKQAGSVPVPGRAGGRLAVKYDSVDTLTHSKLIVIDGYIVILGSHNWTRTSLFLNNEASVLVESPALAEAYLKGNPVSIGNVVMLDENNYFPVLSKHISGAEESISIVMYRWPAPGRANKPTGLIFRKLVQAHKRGVKVSVTLDQQFRSYMGYLGGRETVPEGENFPVFCMLRDSGIDVSFDSISRITHAKLVIIDSRTCILGSQNWTRHSSSEDQDSILIRSKKVASVLQSFIDSIENQGSIIPEKRLAVEGISIPYSFLIYEDREHPGRFLDSPGAKLLDRGGKRCFDLYLCLLKEHKPGEPVSLDYRKLASSIGYSREHIRDKTGKYYRYFYKQNINRQLKKLEELALLKYDKAGSLVYLLQPDYSYNPYSIPDKRYFILPLEFFNDRWIDTLSLKAQYMYLVGLLEDSLYPHRPWWSRSYKGISQMYRINMNTIWEALSELSRRNIIEVYRDAWEPDQPFTSREKNRYFVNPLPDPEELENTWRRLRKVYGKDTLKAARRLAAELDEPNDPWVVEAFAGLVLQYGEEKVKEANSITARFRRSYGKRHIGYTMAILERKWGTPSSLSIL